MPPVEPGLPSTPEYPTQLPDPNDPSSPDRIIILVDDTPVPFVKWWDPEIEEWVYIPEDELPLIDMYPYPNPEPVYDPVPYFTPYPEPSPEPDPEPSSSPASDVPATGDWNVLWLIAFGMSLVGLAVIRSLRRKEDENG